MYLGVIEYLRKQKDKHMDPKTKIIESKKESIEKALDEWGFVKQFPTRDFKRSQIKKWLNNFKPSEIEDAIKLLESVQYKDDHSIRDSILNLAKEIKNIFKNDLNNVKFYPLGESPSSSGGMYLYDYRKYLGLSEDNFPYSSFNDNISTTDILVFFDDMIGSGNQATNFAKNKLQNIKNDVYYISIFAYETGLKRVIDSNYFKQVLCDQILTDEEKAFNDKSFVFEDFETRERLKSLCVKYGKILYPKHPLGYDDSQSLLVFPHNTPNNTLPIYWASENNEKVHGVRWNPLWERKKTKENKTKTIKLEKKIAEVTNSSLHNVIHDLYYKDSFYFSKGIAPNSLNAYSRLFWNFLSSKTRELFKEKGILKENLIEKICDLIIQSKSRTPIIIEGLAGSGKTILLTLIYETLRQRVNHTNYIPIYIDLNFYERKIYIERNIKESARNLLNEHVELLLKLNEIQGKSIILIVNGADEHIKSKVDLFPDLNNKDIFSKKIVGIKKINDRRDNKRKILNLGDNDSELTIELTPLVIGSFFKQESIVSDYTKILSQITHKKDIETEFNTKLSSLNLQEIDFFILRLISYSILYPDYFDNSKSYAEHLECYCLEQLKTDNTEIEQASKIAFESFNLNKTFKSEEINNSGWGLIHSHQSFRNLLIARYVMNIVENPESPESENFNFVYPSEINTHIKYYIESNTQKQEKIYNGIKRIWEKFESEQSLTALTHLSYILGRFTVVNVQANSICFLKSFKTSNLFIDKKNKIINYKSKLNNYIIDDKEACKSLLLIRTVYISLIYLGDLKTSEEYILFCITNPFLENLNRGFHLEYYGDLQYLPGQEDNLLHEDKLDTISLTFSKLYNKITQALQSNKSKGEQVYPLFFVDLFTLCSLIQHRFIREECLIEKIYVDELTNILNQCFKQQIVDRDSALMGYLLFVKKFVCDVKQMSPVSLFNFLYYLKNRHRRGWVLKAGLEKLEIERVSSHVWGAEEIAYDFIRDNNPEYNKDKIIKMIHFHDIAESFTGDLVGDERDAEKDNNLTEKDWFRIISNFGMVDSFANLSDIFTLCNEFNKKESEESRMSNDCDKLECFLQLKNLSLRGKIKAETYKIFYDSLSKALLTDWGKNMLKKFDTLNETHLILENNFLELYDPEFY